jgi:hypothetical protein
MEQDEKLNRFDQLRRATTIIQSDVKKLEKDLGQDAEIRQPQSSFVGMVLVLDVLSKQLNEKVRPSLRSVQGTYQAARSNKAEHVKVDLNMSFLAPDSLTASQAFDDFQREVKSQPWCLEVTSKQSESVDNGQGIYLGLVTIEVDVSKAPQPKEAQ